MAVTLEQFVQHLTASGLMSAAEVSSFQDRLPPGKRPKDGETLARQLVQVNKLTKYQAQAIYQGKVKGLVFGEYVVLDKLGQGGMGVVLKAEHRRMKRVVAVKMISGASLKSPDAVKRFYREVEAAAKLNHSNIVQAYDASEHEGGHYLVMQFVDGKDLGAIVSEKGPLPIAQAVDYIIQAARGLQYAHKQKIVHRDIKPANLLLDKEGTVKILDMGLARIAGLADQDEKDRLTASGQVMGTCDYMAPEQAMDTHHVDSRADIYSLGCTLYRLLAGDAIYKCETLVQILLAHQQAPIPPLCEARSDVSPQLDAVFQRMVAKKPQDRYQSMTEVMDALETCIGKRTATVTSVGEGATMGDNRVSLRPPVPPPLVATEAKGGRVATEAKGGRVATEAKAGRVGRAERAPPAAKPAPAAVIAAERATFSRQSAAAETSKELSSEEKLQPVWRKKKTLVAAIGLGLLGVIGSIAFAVIIRIQRPDGTEQVIRLAKGSTVTVREDGSDNVKAVVAKPEAVSHDLNAPPPAIAPFDEKKAQEHQAAWAKCLGVPVEMTNSMYGKGAVTVSEHFDNRCSSPLNDSSKEANHHDGNA